VALIHELIATYQGHAFFCQSLYVEQLGPAAGQGPAVAVLEVWVIWDHYVPDDQRVFHTVIILGFPGSVNGSLNNFLGGTEMTVRSQFQTHLYTHADAVGFCAPITLMEYLTDLLADRLRDRDIMAQPSFAERYLSLYQGQRFGDIREFGDDTLFFVSFSPEWGRRRGLDIDYFAAMGISAYYTYSDLVRDPRFTQLGNWFYDLQRFLHSALRPNSRLELLRSP
jgi:hypothetical protein